MFSLYTQAHGEADLHLDSYAIYNLLISCTHRAPDRRPAAQISPGSYEEITKHD